MADPLDYIQRTMYQERPPLYNKEHVSLWDKIASAILILILIPPALIIELYYKLRH